MEAKLISKFKQGLLYLSLVPIMLGILSKPVKSQSSVVWEEINSWKPNSLEEISLYLGEIKDAEDVWDYWKSPKKTVEDKKGDCEDKAILGAYLSEKLGYQPKILCMSESVMGIKGFGHVVTLLEKETSEGTKYRIIDGEKLYPKNYDSIDSFVKDLAYPHYKTIDLNSKDINWREGKGNLKKNYLLGEYLLPRIIWGTLIGTISAGFIVPILNKSKKIKWENE